MKTELLATDTTARLAHATSAAAAALRAGDPVAVPTETVYGLAADALRPEAVAKIFAAKERPFFDPLICHLPSLEWLERLTAIPTRDRDLVSRLCARFWPGPLTLVLPKREIVPDLVTSGLETVAVRISAHPVFQAMLREFGAPLAAPSANRFGRISPTAAAHVMAELDGRIPLIIDGGPSQHGLESTIIAVRDGTLQIMRPGPVTREELAEFAPVKEAAPTHEEKPHAPGQLRSHYAPRTPLTLVPKISVDTSNAEMAALAWRELPRPERFGAVEILSACGNAIEAAATLFAKLRCLDERGLRQIQAEEPPAEAGGLGAAIYDRLRKAAGRG